MKNYRIHGKIVELFVQNKKIWRFNSRKKFLKLAGVEKEEKTLDSRKNREIGFTEWKDRKNIIELTENSWNWPCEKMKHVKKMISQKIIISQRT